MQQILTILYFYPACKKENIVWRNSEIAFQSARAEAICHSGHLFHVVSIQRRKCAHILCRKSLSNIWCVMECE